MTSKDSRSRKQKDTNKLTVPVNIGSDHIQGSINNAPYGSRRFRNFDTIGNYSSQQTGTIILYTSHASIKDATM
jgi:hypothetical protein